MLSQLAVASKVRKIFSHCLDTVNGGGIFAIGNVVQPKVKTTPLVPGMYVPSISILLSVFSLFLSLCVPYFSSVGELVLILSESSVLFQVYF
jgi:hypothetical protein